MIGIFTGFGVRGPLYSADGGGGNPSGGSSGGNPTGVGGNGGGNPSGGQPQTGSGGSQQQQQQTGNTTGGGTPNPSPEVMDWDDARQFRFKGQDKPISAKDYVRGFQSQFTKASQEAARVKKELQQSQQELQRIRQAAGGQRGNSPDANGGANMLGEIENAPFIDGKTMGGVIRDFQSGIKERDMVMLAALQKIQQMEKVLGDLHGTNLSQAHETKIKGWLSAAGLGEDQDAFELADIIYRGYEGENLDDEFPQIFEQRWKQMQSAVQRRLTRERDRNRQLPWVPGKGGNAGPGKAQGLTGRETPKQLSDIFFTRFGGQADT